jgi:hypothetical protein
MDVVGLVSNPDYRQSSKKKQDTAAKDVQPVEDIIKPKRRKV